MSERARIVDLRSDTVTQPTAAMRQAMAAAATGDDVYGEDPTVNALEARVSAMLGKPAALFLPSGTMANLVATMVHCSQRGAELLCGDKSHMYMCEQGGASAVAGVMVSTLHNLPDGTVSLEELETRVRGARAHEPRTTMLAVENTHNMCGGKVVGSEWMERAGAACRRHGLALHVDGARLWNASEELRVEPAELVRAADSVSVCFSKGLGAPVGSALAGSLAFINQARRARKVLGGGMRQAGVLAAAALLALDESLPNLCADHRRAHYLAAGIKDLGVSWVTVDAATNIVLVRMSPPRSAGRVAERLEQISAGEGEGSAVVRAHAVAADTLRLVLHRDVRDEHVKLALAKLTLVLRDADRNNTNYCQ